MKSIWYEVEFSGTFKDPPIEGVNETPTTVALKERRFVFGGGVSGIARSVRARMALLPWLGTLCPCGTPLQEARKKAVIKKQKVASLLTAVSQPSDKVGSQAHLMRNRDFVSCT
jgi:hypothetical protein